jgi:predicted Holliday junction resolvase-like endonuclease
MLATVDKMDFITIILIVILILVGYIAYQIGHKFGASKMNRQWERELPSHREDAIKRSRAVLSGNFSEQLAPYLPDFEYSPTECKFLGKPIDFLVFKGSDEKEISEIVFVEVKSGKSSLSKPERSLRDAVKNKKVRWEEYRIPEDLTKKK